jgi:hypothetical protein
MNVILKGLASSAALAAMLASGTALADGAPIRLTDAQMDQVVAGGIFTDTVVDTVVTTDYYHGYSSNLAAGPGPGTSEQETTTTTTTTRTLDCPGGSINSCYTSSPNLNPNTDILSTSTSTQTSTVLLSGPGQSFGNRF